MALNFRLKIVLFPALGSGCICLFVGLFCAGVYAAPDPVVAALVGEVSGDSLSAAAARMVAFETRFTGSDSNAAAARWLRERLASSGYRKVRFDTFAVNVDRRFRVEVDGTIRTRRFVIQGLSQWNVVATKPGVLYPDRYVVVGGHYDSIALDREEGAQDVAPGADDNASGVAAVLEIARALRGVRLEATVVFALFGAEEIGLVGSRDYAADARERGDEILMMLQLDSIGTRSRIFPDAFTIDTAGPYLSLGEALAQAAQDYTDVRARNGSGGRVYVTSRGCGCSDHQSFLDRGYPGLGIFQYIQNPLPHLNTSTDTLGGVDFSLVEGVAKAALAATVQVAGFPARTPDFQGDGQVGMADFLLFAQAFGKAANGEEDARFDLDRDGKVGFSDFLLFAKNFGRMFD